MPEKAKSVLIEYLNERKILLDRLKRLLLSDQRIAASWLAGSLGRGAGDELSDLDLWVVVKDEFISQMVSLRRDYAAQIGSPALFVDAPQNAPLGGGYLAVGYEAPAAPHLVDWYWQPHSRAFLPGHIGLLFDRAGLVRQDASPRFSNRRAPDELLNSPDHFISFFWMMLLIAAKYVCRRSAETDALLDILRAPFRQAADFLELSDSNLPTGDAPLPDFPAGKDFRERLHFLCQSAEGMRGFMAKISLMGYAVPDQIVPGALRYLDLVDHLLPGNED